MADERTLREADERTLREFIAANERNGKSGIQSYAYISIACLKRLLAALAAETAGE